MKVVNLPNKKKGTTLTEALALFSGDVIGEDAVNIDVSNVTIVVECADGSSTCWTLTDANLLQTIGAMDVSKTALIERHIFGAEDHMDE